MVKRLTRNITGRHHVVCDNFFTSVTLFEDLLKDIIYACGTYNYTRKCYPKDLKAVLKVSTSTCSKVSYLCRCGKIPRQCLACQPMCLLPKLRSIDVKRMVVE